MSESKDKGKKRIIKSSASFEAFGKLLNPYLDLKLKLPLERFTQKSKEYKDFMPICGIGSG